MANYQQLSALEATAPAARAGQIAFGVPASVTMAQWILESGWGTSKLAIQSQNYFGIKAEHLDQSDTYMEFPTVEWEHGEREVIQAKFEKYPDMEASFRDHARLLSQAPRYAPAMAVKDDPFAFANALQSCGYSTSVDPKSKEPNYGTMLGEIIREYELTQYDVQKTVS